MDRREYSRLATIATVVALACLVGLAACGGGVPAAGPNGSGAARGSPTGGASTPVGTAGSGRPSWTPGPAGTPAGPSPTAGHLLSLRTGPIRGPRPDLAELHNIYQTGQPPVAIDWSAGPTDWRLSQPDPRVVSGYAGSMSVLPGGRLDLHIRSTGGAVRLDVFRMGLDDGRHLLTVRSVSAGPQPLARPDPTTGLVEERWPASATLAIPADWRSGVYLVKLTAQSGGQAYVPFIVRPATPQPVLLVLPTLTYEAYNQWGGPDLYGWPGGPANRAYFVGYDRPFSHGWGAGHFFNLDFPLIVWLEDHGYDVAYAADVDVARDPSLITSARAVIFSGHAEYWTAALHDAVDAAQAAGVSLLNMGANEAWWQVRLAPNGAGTPDRRIVGYKDARIDPLAVTDPQAASARFIELPHPRPASEVFGQDYGGIVSSIWPMVMGPGVAAFAPASGLRPGDSLPGLIGDEIDSPSTQPGAIVLASSPVLAHHGSKPAERALAGASVWISPSGSHAFDAGTFDWSWGLDPRYAAALPGFPALGFARLTAAILAWAGVVPTVAPPG
jgi:hypothetical protein